MLQVIANQSQLGRKLHESTDFGPQQPQWAREDNARVIALNF